MKALQRLLQVGPCALAFVAVSLATSLPSYGQLGVAVGLNFDSISDVDTGDREATFENASGYHLGLFYDLSAGPIAIRPGIFYRRVQGVDVDIISQAQELTESFDLSLIEVPVDLRLRLTLPFVQPYLLAGPVFGFASTGDEEFEDALQELSVAANIGIGVELNLPGFTPTLFPEIRYAFGISRFMKEDLTIGGIDFEPEDTQRLNTFMIRLGITF